MNKTFRIIVLMLALCLLMGAAALAAEAQPTTVTTAGYTDIAGTEYEDDIRVMATMGLALGYEDNSFRPGRSYTRLETAELVVALLALDTPADYVNPYTDTVNIAGAEAVDAVTAHDFMSGRSADRFEPYSGILKAEFISVLSSIANYLGTEDLLSRLDEELALWTEDFSTVTAAEAMHAARAMIVALEVPEVSATEDANTAASGEMTAETAAPTAEAEASAEPAAETVSETAEASGEMATAPVEDTATAETSAEPAAEATAAPADGTVTAETSAEPAAETAEASGEAAAEPAEGAVTAETSAEPAAEAAVETAEASTEPAAETAEAPTGVLAPGAAGTEVPAENAASGEQAPTQSGAFASTPATSQPLEIDPDDPGAEIKSTVYSVYQNIRDKLADFFQDLLG